MAERALRVGVQSVYRAWTQLSRRSSTRGARVQGGKLFALDLLWERRWPSGTIPSTAQPTARPLVLGFELAEHSLGLVVEGGEDLVGVLFRVVESQAADREIGDFMAVPRSRPG